MDETHIIAGRVLRCNDGTADVLLILTRPPKEEKGCGKCGGVTRCPVPKNLKVLRVSASRPLTPGEDVEVEVWEGPSEYEGGHWGAELLVGFFAVLAGLGLAQIIAQRVWGVIMPAALSLSIGLACGLAAALLFERHYRRRVRMSRLKTRVR